LGELHAALEAKPDDPVARFRRGMAFFLKEDTVNAMVDLQTCLAQGFANVQLYYFLGKFFSGRREGQGKFLRCSASILTEGASLPLNLPSTPSSLFLCLVNL
jgi:hypothetical protein